MIIFFKLIGFLGIFLVGFGFLGALAMFSPVDVFLCVLAGALFNISSLIAVNALEE